MLDTRHICSFSDYFVVCSGGSDRQVEAICQEIHKALKQEGIAPFHSEGTADTGWILLDMGDVIIHIFSQAQRDYYQLEELWSKAKPVIRLQ